MSCVKMWKIWKYKSLNLQKLRYTNKTKEAKLKLQSVMASTEGWVDTIVPNI